MGPTACLLHTDCLFRAGIDAYAAIDAGLRVYLCFSVFHRDCLTGAFLDAGFATSAFFFVNLCRHFNTLSKKNTPKCDYQKSIYECDGRNVTKLVSQYKANSLKFYRILEGDGAISHYWLEGKAKISLLSALESLFNRSERGSCLVFSLGNAVLAPKAIAILRTKSLSSYWAIWSRTFVKL